MNSKSMTFNKIAEIAAGVVAIIVALGTFITNIISVVKAFTNDLSGVSKVFRIILTLEEGVMYLAVIALGVFLVLRWVSKLKLKWVTFIASALSAVMFVVYQVTDYIYTFALAKHYDNDMAHPIRDLFIVLFYLVAAVIFVFLVYDSQNHLIKKNSRNITLIVSYVGVGIILFMDITLISRAAEFIFPLLLIVSVFSRKELDTQYPSYFGLGGIAAALLFTLLNTLIAPIKTLATKTDLFVNLMNYNDGLVAISLALIPLVYLSREFDDQVKLGK